jgi:Leucine-rich repeat (LRR) protein
MSVSKLSEGEFLLTEKEGSRIEFSFLKIAPNVKSVILEYDVFTDKIDLTEIPEIKNLEKLTIRRLELDEYSRSMDFEDLWPFLFENIPWEAGYGEDDLWEIVVDNSGNRLWIDLDLKPIAKCDKLKRLEVTGPGITIVDLNPLVANKNLTELSLQRVMIREPRIFTTLEECQKLTSLYISVAETCSIDKKELREHMPEGIDYKIFK